MKKSVFTVGICLPGNVGEHVSFSSNSSLLDADIVLMRLDMSDIHDYGMDTYKGKPCYGEHTSFKLQESVEHWKRELRSAVESGKTVFILLKDRYDVFVDSGERTHSGTGRNTRTTRIVKPCSNYDILPFRNEFTPASGKVMVLSDKAALLRDYWTAFSDISQYKTIIGGAVSLPLVLSKDKNHVLGALIRFKGSSGCYILLPDIDFDLVPGLSTEKDEKSYWTKKATGLGNQFVESLITIDDRLRSESSRTPAPSWVQERTYDLAAERKINEELLRLEQRKKDLQEEETRLRDKLVEETVLKALLYEQGRPLEDAIIRALNILGFVAAPYRDSESEFDAVFSSAEGRFIGEAEGKDTKPINIDKLRQLEMNIHEDFSREGITEPAKAVLFGNAYRLAPPKDRGDFFTDKCLTAAKRNGCALVRTPDLFIAARYLADTPDADYALICRQAMFSTNGDVVAFPSPKPSHTEENLSTTIGCTPTAHKCAEGEP